MSDKVKWVRLGDYIEQSDERNKVGKYQLEDVTGISNEKSLISTKADMKDVELTPYKIFKPTEFCYVTVTSRNGNKISLALNATDQTKIVSNTYIVFRSKNANELLPKYLFNKDCTNPMALNDAESFYIVLTYNNPDKLSVSSVKINGTKIDSTKFAEGSDYNQTKIRYDVEDTAPTEIREYVINNVMFINGTETTKMRWAENVENTISVSIRPQFNLTLNMMNVDYRMANENRANDERGRGTDRMYRTNG